jgi:N-acetylmuramic acid 6-phosphate etherase
MMERTRLDELVTEARGAAAADHDLRSTQDLVEAINREDETVAGVVRAASAQIAGLVDRIAGQLRDGGRLIYVGAGSSGRIAAVDAAECESTFSTRPGQVVALLAGASLASAHEQDAAEDDAEAGAAELQALGVSPKDAVVGVSASGRTPYTLGALKAAAEAGALTACVVSVPDSELSRFAEHEIAVVVGPEFVAGSTRLKAGTAQKLVLNTLSTVSMIRLGKTFGDLMVDVSATNEKLRARVHRVVQLATGVTEAEAERALAAADGSAKVAIVSLLADVDAATARSRLEQAEGNVRAALAR